MRYCKIFLILTIMLVCRIVSGEVWVRGSAVVVDASGGIEVSVPASGETYDSFEDPVYFPGIFSSRAEADGSALIYTSNGMTLAFSGVGHFSVERFERFFGDVDDEVQDRLAETQSRMILNLRRGELLIDSRSLTTESRFVVETPFGRISSIKAVLLIQIEFDYRSEIYDFAISCAEGTVRLKDLGGESYSIYAGQRIVGAGSYVNPAVEVGSQTNQVREKFDWFFGALKGLDIQEIEQAKLSALTEALPDLENSITTSFRVTHQERVAGSKRPRVIEFAPRADAITPFRGEVKPPSEFRADLF